MTILKPFEYFTPTTIQEAISTLNRYRDKAKVFAGGTDLVTLMRSRKVSPECVVDISNIRAMDYIKENGEGMKIGALTTLRSIENSGEIRRRFPVLAEAVCQIGTVQTRNRATIGGNLCNASPAADSATPLMALEATLKIVGPVGERVVLVEDFFLDANKTMLRSDELLTEIQIPPQDKGSGSAFMKIGKRRHTLSIVNVATVVNVVGNEFKKVRIGLGAVAPTPMRAKRTEAFLTGKTPEEKTLREASEIASNETRPISDIRASAEYRKDIVKVFVTRTIQEALKRAGGL